MTTQHQFLQIELDIPSHLMLGYVTLVSFNAFTAPNSQQSSLLNDQVNISTNGVGLNFRFGCTFGPSDEWILTNNFYALLNHLTNFSELISHILIMPSLEPDTAVLSNRSCIKSWGRFVISSVRSSLRHHAPLQIFTQPTPLCHNTHSGSLLHCSATVWMQLKAAHTIHVTNKQMQQLSYDGAYPHR